MQAVGEFAYPLTLIGPRGEVTLDALVDTGATFTWMDRDVLRHIGVQPFRTAAFSLADGREMSYELGQVTARIDGMQSPILCIFGDPGTQPLIGAHALEAFLLLVDPIDQRLVPRTGNLTAAPGSLIRWRC